MLLISISNLVSKVANREQKGSLQEQTPLTLNVRAGLLEFDKPWKNVPSPSFTLKFSTGNSAFSNYCELVPDDWTTNNHSSISRKLTLPPSTATFSRVNKIIDSNSRKDTSLSAKQSNQTNTKHARQSLI